MLWAPASSPCLAVLCCHTDGCPSYVFRSLYAGSVFQSLPSIPVVAHKVMGRNRAVTSDLSFPHPRRKGAEDICTPQWLTDLQSCSSSVVPYTWALPYGVLCVIPGLSCSAAALNSNNGTFSWPECIFGLQTHGGFLLSFWADYHAFLSFNFSPLQFWEKVLD